MSVISLLYLSLSATLNAVLSVSLAQVLTYACRIDSPGSAGGMVEFRRSLASSFLFRFFVHVATQLESDLPDFQPLFPDTFKSAAVPFHRPPVQGLQYWSKVPGEAVVGQPTRHMAADLQVCHLTSPTPPQLLA